MWAHMHVALVESAGDNEHHIVNHVAVGAVVQELAQGLISLTMNQKYQVNDLCANNLPEQYWNLL